MVFSPKIDVKNRKKNVQKQILPPININVPAMTTITTNKTDIRFFGLPRNKTGLFAADTIHEVKPTRHHLITVPALCPQFRNNGSTNVLLATSEQNHHQLQQYQLSKNEIQQYYPLDGNGGTIDSSNDSRSTINGIRNGFRPSTVRHQKFRLTTATAQRSNNSYENKDLPPKSAFTQSHASAKLRSEIDHINNQLKTLGESTKTLRPHNSRELDGGSPPSPLSYSTSCRLSSASSTLTADRIHRRFTSAITNIPPNPRVYISTLNDISAENSQTPFNMTALSLPPVQRTDDIPQEITDYQPTHAYQIPQQSNVGNESIFLTDPPRLSSIKTRSAKNIRYNNNNNKSVSCPFYVMYLTNLAVQQRDGKDNNNYNDTTPTMRKVPVNSRTSTANPKRQSTKKRVNSPISFSTYSTIDNDNDYMTNSTTFPNNKHLSAKLPTTIEDDNNSHLLRDILRTSSWNHV